MSKAPLAITLAALVVVSGGAAHSQNYHPFAWSISASFDDPFAVSGDFVPGARTLFLWMSCSQLPGYAAEFDLVSSDAAQRLITVWPHEVRLRIRNHDPCLRQASCAEGA